ncbi:bifunctional 2-polyprenyl-6-hydroxyphenol methylase/3-demethylubiquinol 3-O-methyltransferase UbiG [Magnetospirillum sp. UT-4]|uniref:class I SAM-dependent methyltransferase n=1 Tax=Magnetospirillum sp. UT-4 TaxID=2681467 RepID=UPI0013842DA2|nr:class I SAM-dependent methyltransferase [Magnetospirillum sp. UT-4]CAA7612085.1 Methyltransferase family protein [Magnetospirillum sp. UT-4]
MKALDVYAAPRLDRPQVKRKHLEQFDREFLRPAAATPAMAVLEIGCGTGIFLRYLKARGFSDVVGLDADAGLAPVLDDLAGFEVRLEDAAGYLNRLPGPRFDRVALFDVAEHLPLQALVALMKDIHRVLRPGGRVVLRSPNCGSPWGLKMHFDTFDHVTPITAGRLRELAAATGFEAVAVFGGTTGGSALKRLAERGLHGLLSRLLTYRPDFWEATVVGVLEKRG